MKTPITDALWCELMDACKASGIHPSQANKAFSVLPRFRELEAKESAFQALRKLMGYTQDGSQTTVTLWQDDATGDFFVRAGKQEYHGQTFTKVFDQIIQAQDAK
jgi:hypothetical protein